jgi:hypothetical protein
MLPPAPTNAAARPTRFLASKAVLCFVLVGFASASLQVTPGPTPLPTQEFGFGYVFGDDMVLQQVRMSRSCVIFVDIHGNRYSRRLRTRRPSTAF